MIDCLDLNACQYFENDRRTVKTPLFVNVNFYSEIHFDKFVDSKEIVVPNLSYLIYFKLFRQHSAQLQFF